MVANDSNGYYKLLGLAPGADVKQVQKAYKAKQLELHPHGKKRKAMRETAEYQKLSDKEKEERENECDKTLGEINAAYSVIGNKEKKEEYDKGVGQFGSMGGGPGGGNFRYEDIFEMFGMGGNSRFTSGGSQRREEPSHTVSKISLSLKDSYLGKISKFKISVNKKCPPCNGKGYPDSKKCSRCGGHGKMIQQQSLGFIVTKSYVTCDSCHGDGSVGSGPACKNCFGKKTIRDNSVVEVNIKPGIRNNEKIVFQGKGSYEPGKGQADLIFIININENEKEWRRQDNDLIGKINIDYLTLIAGGTLYYTHIDGNTYSTVVDPIKNLSDVIKLSSKGFKTNSGGRGDLYLQPVLCGNQKVDRKVLESALKPMISKPTTSTGPSTRSFYSPLPVSKRQRFEGDDDDDESGQDPFSHFRGSGARFSSFF